MREDVAIRQSSRQAKHQQRWVNVYSCACEGVEPVSRRCEFSASAFSLPRDFIASCDERRVVSKVYSLTLAGCRSQSFRPRALSRPLGYEIGEYEIGELKFPSKIP
jgi:hypothetical protein